MKFFIHILLVLTIALSFFSCDTEEVRDNRVKVARVGNEYFFEEDLLREIPEGLSAEDSLAFVDQYINNWLEEQIVLQKAEEVLPEEKKDVDDRLEKYRKSLLIYAYEQKFIKERLDTTVLESDIEEYYNSHLDDFMLKDYIVKALYLKLSKGTPNIEKAEQHYQLKMDEDVNEIRYYADQYAVQFYYDPEQWVFFDDVLKVIPLQGVNVESFIRKKKKLMFEDSSFVYFINVLDFTMKDAVSPLSFEKEKIKTILLNLKTIDLRNQLREDLYLDAKKAQMIETYSTKE